MTRGVFLRKIFKPVLMKLIVVTGPPVHKVLLAFSESITHGLKLPVIYLQNIDKKSTNFEMVIENIDAKIWQLPSSVFNNDEKLKKVLIVKGWINKEESKKLVDTVTKKCTLKIYATGEKILCIHKKRIKNKKPKIKKK